MKLIPRTLSTAMRWATGGAAVLVIPLSLLLFVQWPLRDWLHAYSRFANDAGQIVFALYAAVAVTAASLTRSHLAISQHHANAAQGGITWRHWVLLLCVAPWAVFLLWAAVPPMLASVAQLESFSEGLTPGYFMLRIALVLLALLALVEVVCGVLATQYPARDADPS